jgi:hypothetical protein
MMCQYSKVQCKLCMPYLELLIVRLDKDGWRLGPQQH